MRLPRVKSLSVSLPISLSLCVSFLHFSFILFLLMAFNLHLKCLAYALSRCQHTVNKQCQHSPEYVSISILILVHLTDSYEFKEGNFEL